MRKIKEVLRLRHAVCLSQDQIARSCSLAQSSVHRYLERAAAAGLSWLLPADWDDRQIQQALFPAGRRPRARSSHPAPDFLGLQQQLQTHPHLTLQLAWEEYRQAYPDGYRYSRFCELYQQWRQTQDLTLRQEHKAGERLFVDYAGATIPIRDPHTGESHPASCLSPCWAPAATPLSRVERPLGGHRRKRRCGRRHRSGGGHRNEARGRSGRRGRVAARWPTRVCAQTVRADRQGAHQAHIGGVVA